MKVLARSQRERMERHRELMKSEEARQLMEERKRTVELSNGLAKMRHGLSLIRVRGLAKATTMVKLTALANDVLVCIRSGLFAPDPSNTSAVPTIATT